jgi:hypothetical protein
VPGYDAVERYAVVPSASRPRILLPAGPRPAALGSALNYRALRGPRERLVRTALGLAAGAGLPAAPATLDVLVPAARPETAASLPLTVIGGALGRGRLHASIGVRTGANRKATLQLVTAGGDPAGYAKLGWNPTTDAYVRTEAAALAALEAAGTGRVRAPRRLAVLDHAEHPVVVTEPLPGTVHAVDAGRGAPTPAELHDLAPVVRADRLGGIGQLRALQARLAALAAPAVAGPVGQARHLLEQVATDDPELSVAARWHGDLTSWNTARDADGTLWVWDWESCEPDAPAGLDALHWAFSIHRERVGPGRVRLADCLADAAPHLTACAVPRRTWDALARVYLAVTIERACGLAVEDGGWDRLWIKPDQLTALVDQAAALTPTS